MKVKDVMSKNFIKVSPNDVVGDVISLLYNERLYYAPVVEDDELVGWIDVLSILTSCKHSKVEDVMLYLYEIKVLNEDDEIDENFINEMINKRIIAYPVIKNNKLVGVLSIFDILKVKK
ncbi:signal transduction protein [Methanocaldococcus villosus KIN24-T80]|uniref:Signal transduction protein n=1 Tax=Methanocaldococcus villosus KIN24-T80 TaxID=1069083 RepID=N6VXZ4_9EURY|nr:CBS domain-containing protein [Methanocaldococcus villosus]ENN96007.1 signal transduction protein [Methanocaldococcus villosus KIN24-T80]